MNIYTPLQTDLYQLTMAYGYWKNNMHDRRATFHLMYRKNPFNGTYAINCGLANVIEYLANWQFSEDDLAYIKSLTGHMGKPLFEQAFITYLRKLRFTCHVDAVPEGTIVFANEPLIRVEGPLLQCQLLETALLNFVNFQTLIATKAARLCNAAGNDSVIEFGMRRAQGPDGALSASRAAYIGGCSGTSNLLAGKHYDIPVKGTHAHSWITAFPSELDAFEAYADIFPNDCILLVDTFDTINGVKNAITIAKKLKKQGTKLLGIRLDSGDMCALSITARKMLNEAGLQDVNILASNSLNETNIKEMKAKGSKINIWGVGTHLSTAYDQPSLDGVYKLTSLQNEKGEWESKLKLSEDKEKITIPGRHQIRRYFYNEKYFIDVIYDLDLGITDDAAAIQVNGNIQNLDNVDGYVDLLEPIFEAGELVYFQHDIHTVRKQAIEARKLYLKTHGNEEYPVALEQKLCKMKQTLINKTSTGVGSGA